MVRVPAVGGGVVAARQPAHGASGYGTEKLPRLAGQRLLDQAALRIVRLAAPFAPFTGDLADVDRLEIIRTWRFERGDRLSSN